MQIIQKKMPNDFNIFILSDDHIGNVLRYDKGFESFINIVNTTWNGIKSKNNYIIHQGDIIEGIVVDDPRYDPSTCNDPIPFRQAKRAIELYKPIKDKIITILDGNHPYKLHKFGNLTKFICEGLEIPYGTWSSKIIYKDSKDTMMFKSFHTHGSRGVSSSSDDIKRRISNMQLSLKRNLRDLCSDVALMGMGHSHKLLVCNPEPELYMTDDGENLKQGYTLPQYLTHHFADKDTINKLNKPDKDLYKRDYIHPDHRWYINSGSFLKTMELGVSSYSERAGYSPVNTGFIVVEVRDKTISNIKPIYF